ncbi:Pyruvate kinase [Desulfonema limicola]|uniref:Pyruvate kinase n=1 Tax=Desulfonema limicola TaxID=45656 RepID=A0A975B7B9_9BACT|nr:pyruvate kinase [Desulfonema limicola]QTA80200.1 Pyruvate kinase [Desulfonema limicola]
MGFPKNKTKIVCTIGPASDSQAMLEKMILSGMDIARLNFSHGDFSHHRETIIRIREASKKTGKNVAIMADLSGPKIRIGNFSCESVELKAGNYFSLTTEDIDGSEHSVNVSFPGLIKAIKPGDRLFLNDGYIQLHVIEVKETEVKCEILTGGMLSSRKGLNIPDIELGILAFTDYDFQCMKFALENGVDAVSQSFVENADDIHAVRKAAGSLGYDPFIIAKIERSRALVNLEEILLASDGIMVARGDLGVEIPIARIAVVQKQIMRKANYLGKPVITATQMLETMTSNSRPTRAEATDVANAIIDGTDCVMLSGESAMGLYPLDAVKMLAEIASVTEDYRKDCQSFDEEKASKNNTKLSDLIALSVKVAIRRITPAAVIVPTRSGATARRITRYRLPVWITAITSEEKACKDLIFSYGVLPVYESDHPDDWRKWILNWKKEYNIKENLVILTEGPSRKYPDRNNRMEIIEI